MTAPPPDLKEFRIEFPGNGLAHIVFDAPGRTMNVFSEAAIVEIGLIARWLEEADILSKLITTESRLKLLRVGQEEKRPPDLGA